MDQKTLWAHINVAIDDATSIGREVYAAVYSGIAGDGGAGRAVLVLIVVIDANPSHAAVVGTVNSRNPLDVRATIQRHVLLLRRGHAKADIVGSGDLGNLREGLAAIDRMPQPGTAGGKPDIALMSRHSLEVG